MNQTHDALNAMGFLLSLKLAFRRASLVTFSRARARHKSAAVVCALEVSG
jgi:hypothetical protein